ncbi:MAG TPA: twin-arginine translocation signal domain-containing protein, partial [Kutzneria sp.]|nr:twin-arginine translocation signal domain-containing protein [Kutzneria sp.]
MISRRMFLGGAAAVAAAVPVGIAVTSWTGDAKAAAPAGLTLSAVNRTGVHADSDLTMYIVGTDPAG